MTVQPFLSIKAEVNTAVRTVTLSFIVGIVTVVL